MVFMFFMGVAIAEVNVPELISKLPSLNQCLIYSVSDSEFDYAATVTVAGYGDNLHFDIGYTPKQELIGAVSYKLVDLKNLKFPILKWIIVEPMVYAGLDRIGITEGNSQFDWGAGVKLMEVKF
jgi:hypothetical protein